MKNIFLLIVLLAAFSACTEQPKDVTLEATPDSFTESLSPTATKDMSSSLKNTSGNSGTITWELSETMMVTGWTYAVMVDGQMQTGTSGSFDIDANATKTVVVKVMPNGNAGTGKAELMFKQDGNTLETISYEATAAMTGPAFSMSTNSETGSATASTTKIEYKSKVTNLTNTNLDLRWTRVIDGGTPGSWSVDVCDINICHVPTISTADFSMPANAEFDLKIGFNPNRALGAGSATVYLYEPNDSANTVQIFTASHTAN